MTVAAAAHPTRPLDGFRHVQTSDLAHLEESVRRIYRGAQFDIGNGPEKLDALANRCQLRDIALTYGRHGTRLRIEIPGLDSYSLLFSFSGSAEARVRGTSIAVSGNRALLASAGDPVDLCYSAEFEQLILYVAPTALSAKLEALLGDPVAERVIFGAAVDFRRPAAQNLRQLFFFLARQVDCCGPEFRPLAFVELEQAAIVSLLTANDSNYSLALNRRVSSAAPWQVRRAEAYVEANWDQPITIEALALVTGVSARTLFHSFRKARGYSPMDFVKRIRLDKARSMLRSRTGGSVTEVAFACGFSNLGHFSTYYRLAFGEKPSATVHRLTTDSGDGDESDLLAKAPARN